MTTYWVRDRAQVLEHREHLAKYRKRHSQADIRSFPGQAEEPSRGGAESLGNMGGGRDSGGVDNLKWGKQRKEGLSRKMSTSFFNWFKDSGGAWESRARIPLSEAQSEEGRAGDSEDIASPESKMQSNTGWTLGKLMTLSMSKMPQQTIHMEGGGLTAIAEDAKTSPELYWPTPSPLIRPQRNVT